MQSNKYRKHICSKHNIYELISKNKVGVTPRNSWKGPGFKPFRCMTCGQLLDFDFGLHFCK